MDIRAFLTYSRNLYTVAHIMKIVHFPSRPWQQGFEAFGFAYHSFDGSYWHDDLSVEFSASEHDAFEKACLEVHAMGLDIVERACQSGNFEPWKLSDFAASLVCESWSRRDPSVYGRFDLTIDRTGCPKIYEYNADTPTSIMEASRAQSDWAGFRGLESACRLGRDMPKAFLALAEQGCSNIAFAGLSSSVEDTANLFPMIEWARQAGMEARFCSIETMQYHYGDELHGFDGEPFDWIFKLYPWEFLFVENAPFLARTRTRFVEPAWKALLSSKAFMSEAWRLYTGHPNLLACYPEGSEGDGLEGGYARKPLYSREGSNVELVLADGTPLQTETGPYGKEGFVKQAYCPMPELETGKRFTFGGWIAGDAFSGICSRFTDDHVVTNVSWTCPTHLA